MTLKEIVWKNGHGKIGQLRVARVYPQNDGTYTWSVGLRYYSIGGKDVQLHGTAFSEDDAKYLAAQAFEKAILGKFFDL